MLHKTSNIINNLQNVNLWGKLILSLKKKPNSLYFSSKRLFESIDLFVNEFHLKPFMMFVTDILATVFVFAGTQTNSYPRNTRLLTANFGGSE